jgi:hypothetical protein
MAEWLVSGGLLPDEEHQANGRYGRATADHSDFPSASSSAKVVVGSGIDVRQQWSYQPLI